MFKSRKSRAPLPVLLVGALALGCGDDDPKQTADGSLPRDAGGDASFGGGTDGGIDASLTDAGRDAATDASIDAGNVLTNAQIVGIIQAANDAEIAAAQIALGNLADGGTGEAKAQTAAARTYAQTMITHHTAAKAMLAMAFPNPGDSPAEESLKAMANSALQTLRNAPTAGFDLVYANSQVEMHQMVLSLIDTTLIPEAEPPLKAQLQTMVRELVQSHRDQAVALRTSLSEGGVVDAVNDAGSDAGASDAGRDAQ